MLKVGNAKHGKRYTKEYEAWQHMKSRCLNQNNKRYADYGGRGITICDRWVKFENFLADIGNAPTPKHTLDRYPNNDGNYEPGNCRWATRTEQELNKRPKVPITYNGITKSETAWAKEFGVTVQAIRNRVKKGYDISKSIRNRDVK